MMRERRSMETQEMCELHRANDRKRKAGKRASQYDDEASVQRLIDRKRKAACRANETEHHAEQRRANNTQSQANKRANGSASDTERRRTSNRLCQASKRANESTCDTEQRRASNRLCQASKRANESTCDTEQRRASSRLRQANNRANESTCDTEQRRASSRLRQANNRANESTCDTEQRRASSRLRQASKRANESTCDTEQRRASSRLRQASKRANESTCDTEQRRASSRLRQASKRANESTCDTEQRRASSRLRQANKRAMPKALELVIEEFLAKVKVGPDFVCTSCHRMLYKHAVIGFKPSKYTNISPQLLESLSDHAYITSEGQQWVCKTCDGALSRGNLPIQAKANGMQLAGEPAELSCLNALEQRLISLRVPFMKMVALPSGKQRCIHGPAVNVPSKIDRVCTMLPRLPSECELVPLKLKRKLAYKGHYLYDYVSPQKLINALRWLKTNNPLYADVDIADDWVESATADDEDLVMSMLEQPDSMEHDENTDVAVFNEGSDLPIATDSSVNPSDPVSYYTNALKVFARKEGFEIHDVPSDGNCLFSACAYQLQYLGRDVVDASSLRQAVCQYLSRFGDFYSDFVHQSVSSGDGYNADNEPPDEEDAYIESITDPIVQQELRYQKYVRRLNEGAWGDSIAVSAMCNMFDVNIVVYCANNDGTSIAVNTPIDDVCEQSLNLGLIMQYHFVGLDGILDNTVANDTTSSLPVSNDNECDEIDDETIAAGDQYRLEITGGTHASMMSLENPEQIVSIAPAEGQKPLFIMSDPNFELMCNPDKFCYGEGGFGSKRERKITYRKYFNARLQDIDGRFARDLDYLFVAQYIVECKQVLDDGNNFAWRQKPAQQITASQVKDKSFMSDNVRTDKAYRFLKNVRGSPPYYQRTFYDLLAMIRQLGTPTWFFTLSAADMKWPDMIQIIARQYGVSYSDDDIAALSFDEKSNWLRRNPVTAARHFQYRLNSFFQDVLKSKAKPLGEIVDYAIRVEFQSRGSPHVHCVLWVKDAPKYGVDSDEDVCAFIDQYVSCAIPADDCKLKELLLMVQQHRHSSYCKRNKRCRFNFPHPPSPSTVIASPCSDGEMYDKAQSVLSKVRQVLPDCDPNATIDDVLTRASVDRDEYVRALQVTKGGNLVLLKREPNEQNVNNYNPSVMLAWQANMDIQYVLDAYACVMYVASYVMKTEKSMGVLLKQVAAEVRTDELRTQLRKIGSAFLDHREVSAQEAVYRLLSLPMKQLSRAVVFVDTNVKKDRIAVLKGRDAIDQLDGEDSDVFQKSLVDRYMHRPQQLKDMCLAEFAASYSTCYNKKDDEVYNDELPDTNSESSTTCKKITLTGGYGQMNERRQQAVIRFRKYNKDSDVSNWYRAKLMLYYPWYDEENDLLGGCTSYAEHYEQVRAVVIENENKYTNEDIENVNIDDDNRPEHAWCQIAPSTEASNAQAAEQGAETLTELAEQDLIDNANLVQGSTTGSGGLSVRYEGAANPAVIPPDEYRELMRGLNSKQRAMIMYHRHWCKQTVLAMKKGEHIKPYRVFLSGPGGVGKSHVIRLIQSDTIRLIKQSGSVEPDDVLVLLTAPTGVAAFNVNGMTLHSAFLLGKSRYGGFQPLSSEKVNTLRSKLSKLVLLIIDEVSMVGADMLLEVHKRLQQIKGVPNDVMFGGVSVLAVGDLYQLPPVAQPMLFSTVRDSYAQLYKSGSIWQDEFKMLELHEIMRQRGDSAFAELLCRVRTASCTSEDIAVLESRVVSPDSPDYPSEALHVYKLNADVDLHNESMLRKIPSTVRRFAVKASDAITGQTKHINLASLSSKRTETGGLHGILNIAVGARVMLTTNVDVADGLVNGARGEIVYVVTSENNAVTTVLVKFDCEKVGQKAHQASRFRGMYPNVVPLNKVEVVFLAGGRRGAEITRSQFPLTLSWATTIHKVQGLTLDAIVVNMQGTRFNAGQIYVALSRVKSLSGLYIVNFNAKAIRKSHLVDDEMTRLRDRLLQTIPPLQCLPCASHVTIAFLNVRSIVAKLPDIQADTDLMSADVLCFCETWLSPAQPSPVVSTDHDVVLRCDRSMNDHKGGAMICVSNTMQSSNTVKFVFNGIESLVTCLHIADERLQVAVVYRSPSVPMRQLVQLMTRILQKVSATGLPTVILGDFNDDLLHCDHVSELQLLMSSNGYVQLVNEPTTDRVTLIDHVYFSGNQVQINVCDVYYSDHDAIYCHLLHPV